MEQKSINYIKIFDTTLRDGEQSPGCSMTVDEKVEIGRQLERLNVDIIEAGFPASSPAEVESIQKVSKKVKKPIICGLARMVRSDIDTAREALKYAKKKRLHVFLATSEVHRKYKLKKGKEEILKMVRENIHYGRKYFDDIEFSPEDASRTEHDFLNEVVKAAIEAGAKTINIPDTVGYSVPNEFADLIQFLVRENPAFHSDVCLSVHCHNDLGLAVANSLAAVLTGARQVECTVNGIGERAGNAAMEEIAMTLDTRKDIFNAATGINLKEITKASRILSHMTGMPVQPNKAIVGKNAFAHESGIHQDGLLKMRQTYEIMDPRKIGRESHELVLGKHSGRHAFRRKMESLGYSLGAKEFETTFERFKKLAEVKKNVYDEDLESLIEDQMARVPEVWKFERLKLHTETGEAPQAEVQIKVNNKIVKKISTGDGPVDACYRAIDKVTKVSASLVEYSIKAVTPGEDALGEVVVKLRVGKNEFAGRGSSTDVIEASVMAYLNAVNRSASYRAPKKTLRPPGRII
jgi:2-isopropylmalate synthase